VGGWVQRERPAARASAAIRFMDLLDLYLANQVVFAGSGILHNSSEVRKLHDDLDGPTVLLEELRKIAESSFTGPPQRAAAIELLKAEIDRIDITLISSLFHPNPKGAARYAAVIHKRAEELREISVQERLLAFLRPEQRQSLPAFLEVGKMMRRFKLNSVDQSKDKSIAFDTALGLKACLAQAEPDVIGLEVQTHPSSDILVNEVFLNLGAAGRWSLQHLETLKLKGGPDLHPHFKGPHDLFTIDVAGQISIGDITRAVIEFDEQNSGTWLPEAVTLSIDGRDGFRRKFQAPLVKPVNNELPLQFPRSDNAENDD
jgi:hypothetical protein